MILDNEAYANTGGHMSKATPVGASIKYAVEGKQANKKDFGLMAMSYKHVYVASIAMGADYNQCITAIKEAENYDGPSIIFAMSPCIDWGMKDMKYTMSI